MIRFLLFEAQDPAVRRRGAQLGQRYAALLEKGVTKRMSKDPAGASPWYVSSFCLELAERDAKRFLTPKVADLPGGPRNLSDALETVSLCIARIATQRPSIVAEF